MNIINALNNQLQVVNIITMMQNDVVGSRAISKISLGSEIFTARPCFREKVVFS